MPRKPVLTLSSIGGDSNFAELCTRYKASHVRLMLFWLCHKSREVADARQQDASLQVLASCCFGLQRATEIQATSGLILETSDAEEARRCVNLFVRCYSWLALKCSNDSVLAFKCRPKLHYMLHTGEDLANLRLNQLKLFATFSEESFLGHVKSIAVAVHGKTLSTRVFQRYLLTLAICLHHFKEKMEGD